MIIFSFKFIYLQKFESLLLCVIILFGISTNMPIPSVDFIRRILFKQRIDKYGFLNPKISKLSCVTWDIVDSMPDIKWCPNNLGQNMNTTLDEVLKHPYIFPDNSFLWYGISQNPNITFQTVVDNINLPWNWMSLSMNPSINITHVLTPPILQWDWQNLSSNVSITMDDVIKHPLLPWVWSTITSTIVRNKTFSFKKLVENPHVPFYLPSVVLDPSLTVEQLHAVFLMSSRDRNKVAISMSFNINLTWQLIDQYNYLDWNWNAIAANPAFTIDSILEKVPDIAKYNLSSHPHITIDIIKKNKDIHWSWMLISSNDKAISIDDIMNNLDLPWDWEALSRRSTLSIHDIQKYPNAPWDFYSMNQDILFNITQEDVKNYILIRSVKIIQKHFLKAIYTPTYTLCNKRLKHEWETLKNSFE